MGTSPRYQEFTEIPLIQHPGASRTGIFACAWLLGALAIAPSVAQLVRLWKYDPLRSLGGFLVAASLALTVWCWAKIDWRDQGTLLGLAPITVAALLSHWGAEGYIAYRLTPDFALQVLQPGVMLCLLGAGIALVLGGVPLLRAAAFPVCLLLLANPVPHAFNTVIDLPLQRISAETARHFAHALGLYPSGGELLMMFTPHFGMMIVPGCNGVRGALTMSYLALIFGWWDGFRPWRVAVSVVGAFLLGYVLNLLRLCLLVIYYWIGMHHPSWQKYGAMVDYVIGGIVFCVFAAVFSAAFFHRGQPRHFHAPAMSRSRRLRGLYAAVGAIALLAAVQVAFGWNSLRKGAEPTPPETAAAALPRAMGAWVLQRTWVESESGQQLLLNANYINPASPFPVRLGLWLSPRQHFALMSEQAHGRRPQWTGSANTADASGLPVHLATFGAINPDNPAEKYTTAESTCRSNGCAARGAGFEAARGWTIALGNPGRGKHLVLTVRVEGTQDTAAAEPVVRDFVRHLNIRPLVEQAGTY